MKKRVELHSFLVEKQEKRKFIKRNILYAICEVCEYEDYCKRIGRTLKEKVCVSKPYVGWCNSYRKDCVNYVIRFDKAIKDSVTENA